METKVCATCFEYIAGGIYIVRGERKIYFCSTNCEHDYDGNKESEIPQVLPTL